MPAGDTRTFASLLKRHSLQNDRFYAHDTLTDASRNSALFVGAFLLGIFVMFRVMDQKLQKRPFVPWMQLTIWTHLLSATMFLLHGLGDRPRPFESEFTAAVVAIGCVVFLARAAWFRYDTTQVVSVTSDVFTHLLVPALLVGWLVSQRHWLHARFSSIPAAAAIFVGILGTWFTLNFVLRVTRGVWVYGADASDPLSNTGLLQSVALVLLFGLVFTGTVWWVTT